jgi:hypothetical protein
MTRLETFTAAPCRAMPSALACEAGIRADAQFPGNRPSPFLPCRRSWRRGSVAARRPNSCPAHIKNPDRWRGGSIKNPWEGGQFPHDSGHAISGMPNIVGALLSCKRHEPCDEAQQRRGARSPTWSASPWAAQTRLLGDPRSRRALCPDVARSRIGRELRCRFRRRRRRRRKGAAPGLWVSAHAQRRGGVQARRGRTPCGPPGEARQPRAVVPSRGRRQARSACL